MCLAVATAFAIDTPSNEYLPPVAVAPVEEAQIVLEPQESAALADDGYRYKVVRRVKYRQRRDVNELPSNEYLPPVASAPLEEAQIVVEPQESAALADDGYRYKVVRRVKYRQRRDVNELPSNEYLPPVVSAPLEEAQIVVEPQESAALADDGYRYKVVRRVKYRQRRDVNELPSNEYLPPVASAPLEEAQIVVEPQESAALADDGYRYKVVRRVKYRQRRDVNELPSNEYLPPVVSAPLEEAQIVVEPQESAALAVDGYRYKVVRRVKYRQRRDVNELPSNEYLPPVASAPLKEAQIVVEPQESAALADDGYRYKVVRRVKYRQRRDVNELPSNEYLPPVASAPLEEAQIVVEPQESAALADDGYRYKVVRRVKYRQRRDVNELPSNEYLPPVASAPLEEAQIVVEPQESAALADDGYRYKVVRRLKYRQRRV
ncbi:uncharacterized protein LOC119673231 [Teleopsis dalmanni]|uniref:uncharacterized protein LOC119673231 n=1 Tax=Teleopsis dalmanni TaxID=139649 RepID=UPI0018CF7C8A|nr:uncharacterized protein LOC119673231 [Teleopsis dalmanni]